MANVVYFMDDRGNAPVLTWIRGLNRKAQVHCRVQIERLEEMGHKLERPDCAYIGDKIYELRITSDRHRYRILFFHDGRNAVVLTNAFLKKTTRVPKRTKEKAIKCMKEYQQNPLAHTYEG